MAGSPDATAPASVNGGPLAQAAPPDLGALAKILVLPLAPFVMAWDGARVLVTRTLPAVIRTTRRLLSTLGSMALAPFRVALRFARGLASRLRALALAWVCTAMHVARRLASTLCSLVAVPWRAVVQVVRRLRAAIRATVRAILLAARQFIRAVWGVLRRMLVAVRASLRAGLVAVRGLWRRVSVAVRATVRAALVAIRSALGRVLVPLRRLARAALQVVRPLLLSLRAMARVAGRVLRAAARALGRGWQALGRVVSAVGRVLRGAARVIRSVGRMVRHGWMKLRADLSQAVRLVFRPVWRLTRGVASVARRVVSLATSAVVRTYQTVRMVSHRVVVMARAVVRPMIYRVRLITRTMAAGAATIRRADRAVWRHVVGVTRKLGTLTSSAGRAATRLNGMSSRPVRALRNLATQYVSRSVLPVRSTRLRLVGLLRQQAASTQASVRAIRAQTRAALRRPTRSTDQAKVDHAAGPENTGDIGP